MRSTPCRLEFAVDGGSEVGGIRAQGRIDVGALGGGESPERRGGFNL
jgi:hypothetical protein